MTDNRFFGHPRGLATLFFTEMWERFSYYGMRALLILFMTASAGAGGLGFSVEDAGAIYGLFTAMVYLAAMPGGWVADRLTGQRIAVLLGGVLISVGNLVLVVPNAVAFYSGLVLVVCGTGLLKPNVSTIVGQLYGPEDVRRDAGFSIFYMGINFGAFIAPLICGWIATRINWRYGFLTAGLAMAFGVVQFALGRRHLGDAGHLQIPSEPSAVRQFGIGFAIVAALVGAVAFGAARGVLSVRAIADGSGVMLLATVALFFAWMFSSGSWTPVERKRLTVVAVLFFAAAVFWSVFEQAGSSMNLFAQRNTDNQIAGFDIPAPWYQSINAMFIISLAPVFGAFWLRLGSREPSSPAKFAWGLGLVGSGFVILAAGAMLAEEGVRVSPAWLLVTYLFHTMGELCLSPVGLSAMTKLAPARVAGLMMGVWFMSLSVGNYMGGRLASFYEALPLPFLFGAVGAFAVAAGLLLAIFVKPITRLMSGVR